MRLRTRTPLALAAIAVALGAYVALVEHRHASTDDARVARTQLIPGLVRADVSEIQIDRGPRGKVNLSPTTAPAGTFADLLDAIDSAEIDREATADANAAGLDPPAARLSVSARGARFVIDVGARDASGRGLFIRRADDARIWVIGSPRLRELLDR